MEVYNLSPREIGAARDGTCNANHLQRTGANAATVFASLPSETREEINDYLGRLMPGISAVMDAPDPKGLERPIVFQQTMLDNEFGPWRFPASSMSDGTLRAFGVLLALFQHGAAGNGHPRVIGIEEPELALHPAATGVLLGALHAASRQVQVIVSSHSPDLLDDPDIPLDSVVAVATRNGITKVGSITEAGRSLIRDRLATAGALMRDNQLEPAQTEAECLREGADFRFFELAEA
jgi:predicted ATPase